MTPLRLHGFVSCRTGHDHVLRHVVRVVGLTETELQCPNDPEQWSAIVGHPPLHPEPNQRRKNAIQVLGNVAGCTAGTLAPTRQRPCTSCTSTSAQNTVDGQLQLLLDAYVQSAWSAVRWGFENPSAHGPRVLISKEGEGIVLEVFSSVGVHTVTTLDPKSGACKLLTCYRDPRPGAFYRMHLVLARRRAGLHRKGMTIPADQFEV